MIDPNLIQKLTSKAARQSSKDMLEAYGEFVIWRHRDPTEQKTASKNAHRMAPDDTTYETSDRYRRAVLNAGGSGDTQSLITGFVPVSGDLIITLSPSPDTKQAARSSRPAQYYRVEGTNAKRTSSGELAHAVVEVKPDRSGRW